MPSSGSADEARWPLVAIVGRPNVGKSALFNRLVGRRVAIVEDQPGVTRDRLYETVEWGGRRFRLVDTGGIVEGPADRMQSQIRRQAEIAVAEADLIVFLVDLHAGVLPDDDEVADILRRSRRPVLLVANKADDPRTDATAATDFLVFGLGEPMLVSAIHGIGTGDLLDEVCLRLPVAAEPAPDDESVRIAFVGKPNVGKSSLVNTLLGEERAIVHDAPGTTRDATDTDLRTGDRRYVLVDTAGLRRRARVHQSVEYYSATRTERAIERANVVVLVIDAQAGVVDQDQRIAQLVAEKGRAMVIAVNKWDLMAGTDTRTYAKKLLYDLRHVGYARTLFVSAVTGRNVTKILDAAAKADAAHRIALQTSPLNKVIEAAEGAMQPPADRVGRRLKIYYATQVGSRPPVVALFVNFPEIVTTSYRRYLEGKLRAAFDLDGTPIRLVARPRRGSGADSRSSGA